MVSQTTVPTPRNSQSLPKKPSIAALSAHLPFLDIEWVSPCSLQIAFHPGHHC